MPGEGTVPASASTAQGGGDVPVRTLGDTKVPYEVLKYIPEESAAHYALVPLGVCEGVLGVGLGEPDNMDAADAVNVIARTGRMPCKIFRVTREGFDKVLAM